MAMLHGGGRAPAAATGLTLVVPLRVEPTGRRDVRRLRRLLATVPPEIAVNVVDDTADLTRAAEVRAVVARRPTARLIVSPGTAAEPFAIGRLRDIGVEAAADGTVMFHDVDFLAPREVYGRLLAGPVRRLDAGAFFCVPVAFLTVIGTAAYRAAPCRTWRRVLASGERTASLARRLVLGSSAIVARRSDLIAAGGHDPAYIGHGAEDFDLLHRLLIRFGDWPPTGEQPCDDSSPEARRGGFAAMFARCGRPALDQGLMLAHLWHPPRRSDARYYAARAANFARLRTVLKG
jgi:predicted glycosyltransferase involved in capsule biosynthesis